MTGDNSLDPTDWQAFRAQGHHMLDDILYYLEDIRRRPVWQPIPQAVRDGFRTPLPREPGDLDAAHATFMEHILPYAVGNAHPGFMGWVHGGGTPVGLLAEMLAAGLNANLGGRDQIPIEVERQVVQWMRELFGFPDTASGLFVTGTSMANFIGLLVARTAALGPDVRRRGTGHARLTAYTSAAAHGCVAQAMDLAGLGTDALRTIPTDAEQRMDIAALEHAIKVDRGAGLHPFFVAGTAGTVDTGAIDDLGAIAAIAAREHIWFHVDGAYGALGMLAPDIAPRLAGIERADSLAFDFHKWGQVPYDAGLVLVRDAALHQATFAAPTTYLRREARGLAGGSPWPCDFGPDLSRGFRALKAWFTLKVYGANRIGEVISGTCVLARYLAERIAAIPELELLAPVSLNIVCFRYRSTDANRVNADIVAQLQASGVAAPSTTTIGGKLAIRTAIVNHRTNTADIDALLDATVTLGATFTDTDARRKTS
ncbi:MAG: pyridoxal phosphate-dependent decarboxylase family protein [Gammaproteobacteria bacterium]